MVGISERSLVNVLSGWLRVSFGEFCGIDLWVFVNGRWSVCGSGRLCFMVLDFWFFDRFSYEFA